MIPSSEPLNYREQMNQSNCLNDLVNEPENKPENKPEKSSRKAKKSPYQTMMMVLVWTLWLVQGMI